MEGTGLRVREINKEYFLKEHVEIEAESPPVVPKENSVLRIINV